MMIGLRDCMKPLAFLAPLATASFIVRVIPPASVPDADPAPRIMMVAANEAAGLEKIFDALGYQWPPATENSAHASLPAIAVRELPGDIDNLPVDARKAMFFRVVAPLIAAENQQLREQREFLQRTFAQHVKLPKNSASASRVRAIARRFKVEGDLDAPATRARLLARVDVIPGALALAQAANESGWGRSRFAREANNLFGMWTWDERQGIRPKARAKNARYFVRVFDSLRASVGNYLHTINIGPAYEELRELRAGQRARGEPLDALALAAGLGNYSARGEKYVEEIRAIIKYNGLHELPPLRLAD